MVRVPSPTAVHVKVILLPRLAVMFVGDAVTSGVVAEIRCKSKTDEHMRKIKWDMIKNTSVEIVKVQTYQVL